MQTDWRRTLGVAVTTDAVDLWVFFRARWLWPGYEWDWRMKASVWLWHPAGIHKARFDLEASWGTGKLEYDIPYPFPCNLWGWIRSVKQRPGVARAFAATFTGDGVGHLVTVPFRWEPAPPL